MRVLSVHLIASALLASLLSVSVAAQAAPPDSSLRLRVGGDVEVDAGDREGAVVVIRGNARVVGVVGALIVTSGVATIDGGRVAELIVIRGHAQLKSGAVVTGDVHLLASSIELDSGSRVEGRIERGVARRYARKAFTVIALIGLGLLAALVVAGVLTALVAPTELVATGDLIRGDTARVVGASALLWLAFPVVALLLVPTLVGLPFGLGYLLFVMPVLGFVGLIVAGTWVGGTLLRQMGDAGRQSTPVVAAAVGITILLVAGRLPLLGIVVTLFVMLGAGAVFLQASRAARRR